MAIGDPPQIVNQTNQHFTSWREIMLDIQLTLKPSTEQKLKKIIDGVTNSEEFAQGIIEYQINQRRKSLLNIKLELKEFEQKYKMSSDVFYEQFTKGLLGDETDFIIWSGLIEMLRQNQAELEELQG
jgi:hypothetical protein